ncbi:hypothetical protein [Flavobacterium sp. W21_SRS_FM6]|uniref:hypothetical protein n=1 Tax=Flavobacterium sp. W21_SRS_FM6 TaxID=3240268 RepID=UPI003F8E8290
MSNSDNYSDDELKRLYQQRKTQNPAPAGVKRHVLAQHQSSINHEKVWRRLTQVALAASTLLLFGLVFWHQYSWQNLEPQLAAEQYTTIELHSLAPRKQSDAISERYAKHYNNYLTQQQVLAFHHKKQAVLQQMDDGWQLQTCDQQVVKVSQELINALRNIHQIEGTFSTGDKVEMMFDKTGLILGIKPSAKLAHC